MGRVEQVDRMLQGDDFLVDGIQCLLGVGERVFGLVGLFTLDVGVGLVCAFLGENPAAFDGQLTNTLVGTVAGHVQIGHVIVSSLCVFGIPNY